MRPDSEDIVLFPTSSVQSIVNCQSRMPDGVFYVTREGKIFSCVTFLFESGLKVMFVHIMTCDGVKVIYVCLNIHGHIMQF